MRVEHLILFVLLPLIVLSVNAISAPIEASPDDLAVEFLKSWIDFEFSDLKTIWYALKAFYYHNCPEGIRLLSRIAVVKLINKVVPGTTFLWINVISDYLGLGIEMDPGILVEKLIEKAGLDSMVCESFADVYAEVKKELDWTDIVLHPIVSARKIKDIMKAELSTFKPRFLDAMKRLLTTIAQSASSSQPSTVLWEDDFEGYTSLPVDKYEFRYGQFKLVVEAGNKAIYQQLSFTGQHYVMIPRGLSIDSPKFELVFRCKAPLWSGIGVSIGSQSTTWGPSIMSGNEVIQFVGNGYSNDYPPFISVWSRGHYPQYPEWRNPMEPPPLSGAIPTQPLRYGERAIRFITDIGTQQDWRWIKVVSDEASIKVYYGGRGPQPTWTLMLTMPHGQGNEQPPYRIAFYWGNERGYIDDIVIYAQRFSPQSLRSDITEGLVGYWRFDEGTGNVAVDSSGHNNDGVIHGATYVQGILGTALYFDGSDFVDLGKPAEFYATSMTIAEWVKFTAVSYPISVTVNDYSASDGEWGIIVFFDKDGHPQASVGAGLDNHAMGARGHTPLNDGRWHFIVAVYDNDEKTITLYVDGEKIAQNNWFGTDGGFRHYDNLAHDRTRCGWYIGIYSQYFFNPSVGPRSFIGAIDEVRIYNRALSAEEVLSLYALYTSANE